MQADLLQDVAIVFLNTFQNCCYIFLFSSHYSAKEPTTCFIVIANIIVVIIIDVPPLLSVATMYSIFCSVQASKALAGKHDSIIAVIATAPSISIHNHGSNSSCNSGTHRIYFSASHAVDLTPLNPKPKFLSRKPCIPITTLLSPHSL